MCEPRIIFHLDDVGNPYLDGYGSDFYVWAKEAIEAQIVINKSPKFDLWSLDFDLSYTGGSGTGMDFLEWAAEHARNKWPLGAVYVHSHHPTGARAMRKFIAKVEEGMPENSPPIERAG